MATLGYHQRFFADQVHLQVFDANRTVIGDDIVVFIDFGLGLIAVSFWGDWRLQGGGGGGGQT
jgi:hypothetical protein